MQSLSDMSSKQREDGCGANRDAQIEAKILELCINRGPAKSICPSEVARALEVQDDKWRALMKPVRTSAIALAEAGRIDILRKGKRTTPSEVKGVIRLRIIAHNGE